MPDGQPRHRERGIEVRRHEDGHPGQASHQCRILVHLVHGPVLSGGEARMGPDQDDPKIRDRQASPDLVERPRGEEGRRGDGDGFLALQGKARRGRHHVLF